MQMLTGFLGWVFALCISSATTPRGAHWLVYMDIRKKSLFLFLKKKKTTHQRAPVLLLHLEFGNFTPFLPPVAFYPTNYGSTCLSPPAPHFYCFL